MQKNKSSQKRKKSPLNKSLNFTPADLQANQQGFISFEQKRRLKRLRLLGGTTWISGIWLVINVANLCLMGFMLLAGLAGELDDEMIVTFIFLGVILIPFSGAMVYITAKIFKEYWHDMTSDIVNAEVTQARGIVKYEAVPSGKITNYFINIGDEQFPVSKPLQEQFSDNTAYNIFFAPESRILLSAKQLPLEQANDEQA